MEKLLNLQLFADETKATVTLEGYMDDVTAHEFYDRTLKKSVYDEYTLHKYTDTIKLPKNNGKTMVLRKLGKYVTNGQPLVEGSLPTEDEPMKIYEYRVGLNDLGGYITYSDQVDIYSLNSGWGARLQENQGNAVGELFQNKLRDIMYSSVNRWIAGATDFDSLQDARDTATAFNLNDLTKIRTHLKRTKVKPMADGNYLFLISPEVEAQVLSLTKNTKTFTFVEIANQHQNGSQIYAGNDLGTFMGFRFISMDALGTIDGATSSATSNGDAIHGCLVLGRYRGELGTKIVKLEGYGEPKTIVKPLGSAGTNDPLDQKGSIAWKCMGWGGTVLYPEAVLVYECLAETPTAPFVEEERPSAIKGGSNGKGDPITPVEGVSYVNYTKVTKE